MTSKKKIYVIDTNVFLTDPNSIVQYSKEDDVVIPFKVLEEVDNHKNRQDSVGVNARCFIRFLDELRGLGSLYKGVSFGNQAGQIFIRLFDAVYLPEGFDRSDADNQIISVAIKEKQNSGQKVVLVSKDINMRVKCDALDLRCDEFSESGEIKNISYLYSGYKELEIDDVLIDKFYEDGDIASKLGKTILKNLYPNQLLLLRSKSSEKKTALARFISDSKPLVNVADRTANEDFFGLVPRNKEQKFALDLLTDTNISLVTLTGKSGSGKTILSIAAGLHSVLNKKIYKKIVVIRPIVTLGKDLGYLPGTVEEKLSPFTTPIIDNLTFLLGGDKRTLEGYFEQGVIEVEAMPYIRGRSIANSFMLIDEVQNISLHEIKTILTRAGEGTKIVLTGDLNQIDNIHLTEVTSGLTYAVEKFKSYEISGHISLVKGERSALATLASEIL